MDDAMQIWDIVNAGLDNKSANYPQHAVWQNTFSNRKESSVA
jgi:hypothetical protein